MNTNRFSRLLMVAAFGILTAAAATINFNFYVDDYATVTIDGTLVGSYNDPSKAGTIAFALDLNPGWHSLAIDYANQFGTNFLALRDQYPQDPTFSTIPINDFRSLDQTGHYIDGLRADYFSSIGGSQLFTVYGEGPIDHGALSFTNEIYQGVPGLWAGVFGPSALFAEHLTGDILIASVPEPASGLVSLIGLLYLVGLRFRRNLARL